MKNERSRPDWGNRGFVFWCLPEKEQPFSGSLKETLKDFDAEFDKARSVWNRLVEANQAKFRERNLILKNDPVVGCLEKQAEERESVFLSALAAFKQAKIRHEDESQWKKIKDDAHTELSGLRERLREERKRAAKEMKPEMDALNKKYDRMFYLNKDHPALHEVGLNTNNTGGAIFKSFNQTRENLFRGIGGWPKFKKYGDSMSLKMANNSGGWPVADFFDLKGKKFSLSYPDGQGHASFLWEAGGRLHKFRMVMHRSFPEGAYIKGIRLKREAVKKWRIVFEIEEPPKRIKKIAGEIVIVCPKWTKVSPIKGGEKTDFLVASITVGNRPPDPVFLFEGDFFHPEKPRHDLVEKLARMDELQSRAGKALDGIKERLIGDKAEIERVEGWDGNVVMCGRAGLGRLLAVLEKREVGIHPIVPDLRKSLDAHDRAMGEKNGIEKRIARYRDWFYWNFGAWIADRAKMVIWDDIGIKELGVKRDIEKLPEEVAAKIRRQKRFASPGDLLDKIRKQCSKRGVEVVVAKREKSKGKEMENAKEKERNVVGAVRISAGSVRGRRSGHGMGAGV